MLSDLLVKKPQLVFLMFTITLNVLKESPKNKKKKVMKIKTTKKIVLKNSSIYSIVLMTVPLQDYSTN